MLVAIPVLTTFALTFVAAYFCKHERLVCLWYFISGFIQLFMETNYGILHHMVRVRNTTTFVQWALSEMHWSEAFSPYWWVSIYKQYARYDGRYSYSEPAIVTLSLTEAAEAVACFALVILIQTRSKWRHPIQIINASWQFYGTILYFLTPYIAGTWDKEFNCSVLEFVVYVVGLNGIWFVVPAMLIWQSAKAYAQAFSNPSTSSSSNGASTHKKKAKAQ